MVLKYLRQLVPILRSRPIWSEKFLNMFDARSAGDQRRGADCASSNRGPWPIEKALLLPEMVQPFFAWLASASFATDPQQAICRSGSPIGVMAEVNPAGLVGVEFDTHNLRKEPTTSAICSGNIIFARVLLHCGCRGWVWMCRRPRRPRNQRSNHRCRCRPPTHSSYLPNFTSHSNNDVQSDVLKTATSKCVVS